MATNQTHTNVNARIPVEQHQALLEVAADRDVKLSDVLRDAINHYLGSGERGDLLTGPEAGYLAGRSAAMRAIGHHIKSSIPDAGEDFVTWCETLERRRAAGR